ncbi:hypothetical protein PsYK624_078550 [Phanerochaete sordida]|uniref:F-box domain-containing protein n=1 Tax=Phanerochaete sordida TaxID=48140 RepID=A0A9P3LDX7_9APHY|nr:hypothetical protein PsYK624_078550 [Phanerochaete sordida]
MVALIFDCEHLFHARSAYHEGVLPIELAEACVDWLGDDQDALYACARVCRAWLPRAYSHRFRRLRYGGLAPCPGYSPPQATSLVRLLDYFEENDRVCTFVRELHLKTRRERLQLNVFRRLLSYFPYLAVCELDSAILNSFTSTFTYPRCPYIPRSLQILKLRAPRVLKEHTQLHEILELFRSIDDLRICLPTPHPSTAEIERRGGTRRQPGLKVARLTLDSRFPRTAVRALQQLPFVLDQTSLRTLSCPAFGAHTLDPTALELFLRDCGASLTELDVGDAAREADSPLPLHACPAIAMLSLTVPLPVGSELHGPSFNGGWNTLCAMLWSAPPSLQELRLTLDPVGDCKASPEGIHARECLVALDGLDWSAVDKYLRGRSRGSPHVLRLRIVNRGLESASTFLLVARQLLEEKFTTRVRHHVQYAVVSPLM